MIERTFVPTAVVSLFSAMVIGQTNPTTTASAMRPELREAFREWFYQCKPFPSDGLIEELRALPMESDHGEVLFWQTKERMRSEVFRMTRVDFQQVQALIQRAGELGYDPANAETIHSALAEKRYKDIKDRDLLIRSLTILTKRRVPDALNVLGSLYRDGEADLAVDLPTAERCFEAAIKLGDLRNWRELSKAQELAGDHEAAFRSLIVGADAGDVQAMDRLASWYAEGRNVERDPTKATERYRQAADRGFPPAQLALAKRLDAAGDFAEARRYADLAAASGLPAAVAMVNEMQLAGKRASP